MKITRKSRKIKSRYIGSIDDYGASDCYGRSPALDYFIKTGKLYSTYNRIYSDEIPLPDFKFCMERSEMWMYNDVIFETGCSETSLAWVKLAAKILERKNKLQLV